LHFDAEWYDSIFAILQKAVFFMQFGVKRRRGDEKIHFTFGTPPLDHLINFTGQSIPLAYLKVTLQKNTLGADRYIVVQGIDHSSSVSLARPEDGIGKSTHIINMNNVW
jgi:hypothetical protein